MTPTQQVRDLFGPLLGQLIWNVHGGYGSFLTLEFGKPHIVAREPTVPSPGRSESVVRALKRRRVFIVGDWSFFIQYCDWKLSVADGSLDSQSIGASPNECLADLDGQRLVSLQSGKSFNSWKFQFDLGGALEVWPSAAYEPTDDMWHLRSWSGEIAALQSDGRITFEKAARDGVKPSTGA